MGAPFLIIGLLLIMLMLILPLPAWLMDFLLSLNLVASLTLLLISISLSHPLKLASFPSLLLIATLYRLGLNVSSTRLILAQGYPGEIIQSFGNYASSGNLLVGLVVFIILILIQFIVIAKGSERVAEVSARFSLDALPGKQMSIDADLRSGLIHQNEARVLRKKLEQESKLYGSMDGAMKFVKGDAIAGIIIILINILGGLGTGVLQKGYSIGEALTYYSILTIGDGLVSQIPSIFIALSAGFLVTRVSEEDKDNSLGKEIGNQVFSNPKILFISAFFSFLLGSIPGFPFLFFFLLSITMSAMGLYSILKTKKDLVPSKNIKDHLLSNSINIEEELACIRPFILELSPELFEAFDNDPRWSKAFNFYYPKLRQELSLQMGLLYPELKIRIKNKLNSKFSYRLLIYELTVFESELDPYHCFQALDEDELKLTPQLFTTDEEDENFDIILNDRGQIIKKYKLKSFDQENDILYPEEILLKKIAQTLKKHSAEFLSIQEVRDLLNHMEIKNPELVREVTPKMISIQKLTQILKKLVEEAISIRDLRLILQTLSSNQADSKTALELNEEIRQVLHRQITKMVMDTGRKINLIFLSDTLEEEIRQSIHQRGEEAYLAMRPERLEKINKTFVETFQKHQDIKLNILTSSDIRRYVRKMIEKDLEQVHVLSYQDLTSTAIIRRVDCIDV